MNSETTSPVISSDYPGELLRLAEAYEQTIGRITVLKVVNLKDMEAVELPVSLPTNLCESNSLSTNEPTVAPKKRAS